MIILHYISVFVNMAGIVTKPRLLRRLRRLAMTEVWIPAFAGMAV